MEKNPKLHMRPSDPLLQFQFAVEVTMKSTTSIIGYFTEVSNFDFSNAVTVYKAVDSNGKNWHTLLPGLGDHGEITLKRGLTTNMGFWEWRMMIDTGRIALARSTVTLTMYNRYYEPSVTWHLEDAWPSKISGPQMTADSSDIAVEELSIVFPNVRKELFDMASWRAVQQHIRDLANQLGIPYNDAKKIYEKENGPIDLAGSGEFT